MTGHKCPFCGSNRHTSASGTTYRSVYCAKCKKEFEPDDCDGTVGYGRPDRHVERQEAYELRKARRNGRNH